MPTQPLMIVALPSDTELLHADVAGYPVHRYLLERLRLAGAAAIQIAVPFGSRAPSWCDAFPTFAGTVPPDCEHVVVIDARSWLGPGVLERTMERLRGEENVLRIRATSTDPDGAGDDTPTLAAALPAGSFAGSVARALTGIDRVWSWEWADDASDVAISSAESASPSRLLTSFLDLAAVEQEVLRERAATALRSGVRVRDPQSVQIRGELTCGAGVEIDINVILEGRVTLADGVRIGAHAIIRNAQIGQHTRIEPYSLVEASSIGAAAVVGPYGRVRPGSTLGDRVQIGNFVEIKNSRIGAGARINHHAFVGDADVADGVTIGAGTITCNHDGIGSVPTVIESGAYIGSGCTLVAPLRIGAGATIGAGSTITRDVPGGTLTVARSRQTTIENWRGPRGRREPRT